MKHNVESIMTSNNSLVCVGLDSDLKKLPTHLQNTPDAQFLFNQAIIDATHDLVCAYKLNSAFYEGQGIEGIDQLKKTCDYLKTTYPEIYLIVDAKRGDIGNTNHGYVEFVFEYLGADAVTVHPYLGREALQPFLDREDKATIILCRTSNPGAGEFQDLLIDGIPLYQHIARTVSQDWNRNGNCMLVVGATYPDELATVRSLVGDMILLVPGIGAQGGDIEKAVHAGLNSKKEGMIINASRSIIFASQGQDFAQRAREETEQLQQNINRFR